jgi:2-methylcitrate dehydratase
VQSLLRKVTVRALPEFSEAFPAEMPARICVYLRGGQTLRHEVRTYPGFFTTPLSWDLVEEKFHRLADPCADRILREAVVNAIANLEQIPISELMRLLEEVGLNE